MNQTNSNRKENVRSKYLSCDCKQLSNLREYLVRLRRENYWGGDHLAELAVRPRRSYYPTMEPRAGDRCSPFAVLLWTVMMHLQAYSPRIFRTLRAFLDLSPQACITKLWTYCCAEGLSAVRRHGVHRLVQLAVAAAVGINWVAVSWGELCGYVMEVYRWTGFGQKCLNRREKRARDRHERRRARTPRRRFATRRRSRVKLRSFFHILGRRLRRLFLENCYVERAVVWTARFCRQRIPRHCRQFLNHRCLCLFRISRGVYGVSLSAVLRVYTRASDASRHALAGAWAAVRPAVIATVCVWIMTRPGLVHVRHFFQSRTFAPRTVCSPEEKYFDARRRRLEERLRLESELVLSAYFIDCDAVSEDEAEEAMCQLYVLNQLRSLRRQRCGSWWSLLLLLCGDVERNPGPAGIGDPKSALRICPQCQHYLGPGQFATDEGSNNTECCVACRVNLSQQKSWYRDHQRASRYRYA